MFNRTLLFILFGTATALAGTGCSDVGSASTASAYIKGEYDDAGRLRQISYDRDKNGHADTVAFMDGTRFVRIEIDSNEDGLVDRWEYYGADQKVEKVGLSKANNGRPDTWIFDDPKGQVAKIELSPRGDGKVGRTEYYESGSLTRAEEDSDGDGRLDHWESYQGGVLKSVAFDTAGTGKPDRRLLYGAGGGVEKLEVDSLGDGTFKAVAANSTADNRAPAPALGAR